MKKIIQKELVLFFAKSLFFLLAGLSCFYPKIFKIGPFQIYNLLLGIFIILINYFLVFTNFKRNLGFMKFLFLFENIFLILISFGFIIHSFLENKYLKIIFSFSDMVYYILIVHSIIQLYISYFEKNDFFPLSFQFILYIALLSISFYLLGRNVDINNVILNVLSALFFCCFYFYLFIFFKKIIVLKEINKFEKNKNFK
ncbi:hypothetical protein FEF22_001460 [Texas Phoenix palm phytoplasma]|uniref:Uncharacterized protein n=1 Tax=Texas Phoenix palm phytoplasma TaxID=176709 RepID=A0ABS5BIN3_9MOLU|nr:hypothetical protein [Texas Phoenix palm phytoplasma]MBP3059451.1 hypothetical protein [Texas Phoenix palm phytoplasma]